MVTPGSELEFRKQSGGGARAGSVGWYIEPGWLAFRKRASVYRQFPLVLSEESSKLVRYGELALLKTA